MNVNTLKLTEYAHGQLRVVVNEQGLVSGLSFRGDNLMLRESSWTFSLTIDGQLVQEWTPVSTATTKLPNGVEVTLEYSSSSAPGLRVWQIIDLYGDAGRIERWVHVATNSKFPRKLTRAILTISGITAGDPANTKVSVPMTRIVPGTPLSRIAQRPREFESPVQPDKNGDYDIVLSSPDLILGTVTFSRLAPALHVAITPFAEDIPASTRLYGDSTQYGSIIEHEFADDARLDGEETFTAGEQVIQIQQKDWRAALPAVGKLLAQRGFVPPSDRPAWASNIAVYEADPVHHGGFRALAERLDSIVDAGFDTLYIMPWHVGSYGTVDYLKVAPELGTFDDLIALTSAAHDKGMKVLFDLLLVVAAKTSPYLSTHPDWFYRDAAGNVMPHPVWKAPCLDPASPSFREFLTDYAVRCCSEWGADGFRVDAAGHRGGNWESTLDGLQPYEHSAAVFTLIDEVRDAIRAVNPDAILLSEVFGPELVRLCDLVCWQWVETVEWLVARTLAGEFSGATLQRIVGEQLLAQPTNSWLTFFTVNHDTKAFTGFDREGDAERALWTTLALIGAGFLNFGGGWGMRDRPAGNETNEYKRVLETKRTLGGLSSSDVRFPACEDDALFVALRPRTDDNGTVSRVIVVTNFSAKARPIPPGGGDVIISRLGSVQPDIQPWDTIVTEMRSEN